MLGALGQRTAPARLGLRPSSKSSLRPQLLSTITLEQYAVRIHTKYVGTATLIFPAGPPGATSLLIATSRILKAPLPLPFPGPQTAQPNRASLAHGRLASTTATAISTATASAYHITRGLATLPPRRMPAAHVPVPANPSRRHTFATSQVSNCSLCLDSLPPFPSRAA